MPAIPSATETVRDYGLGLTQPASMTPVVLGVASAGPQNALTWFSDPSQLRDLHGEGPGVENAANVLSKGGGPIGFVRLATAIAASNGTVTVTGTSPTITLSGTATIDAHVRVEILLGGALGVAKFRYSCDAYSGDTTAERTYSETLLVPSGGAFAVPNLGITITFPSGTYVLGDFYEFDVQCAAANATDLANGFVPLAATNSPWRFAVFVTSKGNGDSAAHATLAAALQAQLNALAAVSKYRRAMMPAESGGDAAATVVTSFASTVAARLLLCFGRVRRTTVKPFPGFAFPVTHALDCFAARAAAILPVTDLKRVEEGPLDEIAKILLGDERRNPTSLDDAKISTLRTFEHRDGFFITQGRLKSPSGSDFQYWPMGLVMDIACETVNAVLTGVIGRGVRYADNGGIDDRDATNIEDAVNDALATQLKTPQNAEGFNGYVTDVRYWIDRNHNFLADGVVQGQVGIKPIRYIDYVKTQLGFVVELPAAKTAA